MNKKTLKNHLHECLRQEVIMSNKSFSWLKVLHKAFKCPDRRFNFWWRIASYLFHSGGSFKKNIARHINRKLIQKYNTEIQLPATIESGLVVTHFLSVAINGCSVIGSNFKIRHNCTIGIGGGVGEHFNDPIIRIGDNVEIGTGTCIIGHNLTIGDNVSIGAMSFINKDIPNNTVVFTEKKQIIKLK